MDVLSFLGREGERERENSIQGNRGEGVRGKGYSAV